MAATSRAVASVHPTRRSGRSTGRGTGTSSCSVSAGPHGVQHGPSTAPTTHRPRRQPAHSIMCDSTDAAPDRSAAMTYRWAVAESTCQLMRALLSSRRVPASSVSSPCRPGCPSSRPASRVVNPSSTVACTTARSSGDSDRSAPAGRRVPSAQHELVHARHQRGWLIAVTPPARAPLAQQADQPADRDAPHPAGRPHPCRDSGRPMPHGTNVSCNASATRPSSAHR